ncbi:MAG: FAD-binding domain-containing protein [Burkholderiaceae bacterium]
MASAAPLAPPAPAIDWQGFEPTPAAALRCLQAVRPHDYARSRNHLQGAVTGLSPYITHGLLTLPQVLDAVQQAELARCGKPLDGEHKFINELAWREYFHHAWRHEGRRIFASLHEGPLPDGAYARQVDADIRAGATGVPAIDQAVRQLYATGWLHNHARMWLASYMVHLRKVHWRAAADWMYGHLIDGDLASNHLSWQWVAGTGSHKPYLFNAGNVARFASEAWHSPRSVIDRSYEALEAIATSGKRLQPAPGGAAPQAVDEPALTHEPPFELPRATAADLDGAWLIHPWNLRAAPSGRPAGQRGVGVFVAPFHKRWAWSARRWQFVLAAMREHCDTVVWCGAPPPATARTVADPHLGGWWPDGRGEPVPRIWADPGRRCGSFSQFWNRIQKAR